MIDAPSLLKDLQRLLKTLEADLRERTQEVDELDADLRAQHRDAFEAKRTGAAYEMWRDERLTQVAVAWILGGVFVRFLEDNQLVATARLAGPGPRRQEALDQHELYFKHPDRRVLSDREYLLDVFAEAEKLRAAREVFDRQHNPLWCLALSGVGATTLLNFWQRLDPTTGVLVHDFTDPEWNTRFLGDLYQDLSESARKKYALLQTPDFVEEFILDRTLTPALDEFGLAEVRLIDPTCGSGHFLLGAFHRLLALWRKREPATSSRELVQRALDQVYGVDLNPFAVAIARFRLLVAALEGCEVKRLDEAPGFRLNLAVGDSLLHGKRFRAIAGVQRTLIAAEDPLRHVYETEDAEALGRILGQQYHAVVGNPPYITVKDPALRAAYRAKYSSCHQKYSLAVPFIERFFELAAVADASLRTGFTGLICANSFMKRAFGKKLIENLFPLVDLTYVIDTTGAYIPGHGTPTVILFGKNRPPFTESVRAVMGIRGEPVTPATPAEGKVWTSIIELLDRPGEQNDYISVANVERRTFSVHPWTIGGGGAAELKSRLELTAVITLSAFVDSIGIVSFTLGDDVFLLPAGTARRHGVSADHFRPMVIGEAIRDWAVADCDQSIFPYDSNFSPLPEDSTEPWYRYLWRSRAVISKSKMFGGQTKVDTGLNWYEYGRLTSKKIESRLSIVLAFVATHNHFALDRGGKVFKQTAPIIKLPADATEDDHLALLGLLNSSTACFWMQQMFYNKGGPGGASSKDEKWHDFYEHDSTKLKLLPIPANWSRIALLARELVGTTEEYLSLEPRSICTRAEVMRLVLDEAREKQAETRLRQIALQEELDWRVLALYGLVADVDNLTHPIDALPPVPLGTRAFEIELARRIQAGKVQSRWFESTGAVMTQDVPRDWPESYRLIVERRLEVLRTVKEVALIEQVNTKRRWEEESWSRREARALRSWLGGHLETPGYWANSRLLSTARLADAVRHDEDFMKVATCYRDHADFDVGALVAELVVANAAPLLSSLRFKPAALEKHQIWKRTWDLQRQEDAIDARSDLPEDHPDFLSPSAAKSLKASAVGDIPVPPKYKSSDYRTTPMWQLRGKLDVPKETFLSFPHCERDADPSLVVGWAGWNHLEQAQAISTYYLEMKEQEGWSVERLQPLLAVLREVVPWVKQWHNELDAEHGVCMGDYFADFVDDEIRALELTVAQVESWEPPKKARGRKASKKKVAG
jgi:hypothetical protein